MVRSNPFSTSEEASALSASSEASVVADTFGLLRTMSKYIAFVWSSCNLSMYSESLLLPPVESPEGEGLSSVVFAFIESVIH